MDIVAHGVYSLALNKTIDRKRKSFCHIAQAFFWGIMPDMIAMGPSMIIALASGSTDHHAFWKGYDISAILYPFTHSLIIFGAIFFGIAAIIRKWYLPMLGWGFHILLDIPFHTAELYPTPFLFPISALTLPFGIYWGTPVLWIGLWLFGLCWLALVFYRPLSNGAEEREERPRP